MTSTVLTSEGWVKLNIILASANYFSNIVKGDGFVYD